MEIIHLKINQYEDLMQELNTILLLTENGLLQQD
jgi:hypothetical protein